MLDLVRLRVLATVAKHGSVTEAAKELHYSQPSVSQQLAKLESETGAQLVQRVGRGIRLTEAGALLADRAEAILGRVDAAATELAAHVGLRAGRVRLAGFSSALVAFLPAAASVLNDRHPGLELEITETHPPEALQLLRSGSVDLAIGFRYAGSPPEEPGIRTTHLLDDPSFLLTSSSGDRLTDYRTARWIAGCERHREQLLALSTRDGFVPNIAFNTDDIAVKQALVAAGMGVTIVPGLAIRQHLHPGVRAIELPDSDRQVYAATYGEPPDPPPTAALLAALTAVG
ncbi:LysR family transcriptional regulator [Solihabitans fulvus]|uniref:LysR family transcriptional regulator n=1 Tax=Solihabitans fulvus TaxID=1892852 RepID=A0A5B2XR85_9PSEU|nr:LysR family transcriptional regulator [Solihabitans fulvus]KAA2265402.1 LysR family transcriptional regulator [Solihabitans fulvus]